MVDRLHKFTDGARRVLSMAQEEAMRFHHNYIGTEHVLLGLLRDSDSVAARVLGESGLGPSRVRSAVEQIIGFGDQAVAGQIGLTPRVRKVIELAVDEAYRLDHRYVGTEHLLLALIREGEGIAAGVLVSFGLTLDRLRARTLAVLGEQGAAGQETKAGSGPMRARGRVITSSTTVHMSTTSRRSGPFIEPTLEELIAVIPVGQTQRCNGADVTILSVELYADGLLVNLRLLSEPSEESSPLAPSRVMHLAFEAEDDRGNPFDGRPYFVGESGAGRQIRYMYRLTPGVDQSARELRLWCTDPRQPGGEEAVPEACNFSIPLGGETRS